jgi:glucosamine kinase
MKILIADSGSTKCEWVWLNGEEEKTVVTKGISPYFLNTTEIAELIQSELLPSLPGTPEKIYYYGTGCAAPANAGIVQNALKKVFQGVDSEVTHDLMAAARALCGREPGIACILGTGSNSCYYDGKEIVENSPGLGYVLGDEGSGTYLGKKVLQYYLYKTFDEDLHYRFEQKYNLTKDEILFNVYKQPLPNRFLAQFALFLAENRGHYMIENIIEDGLNDFFFYHISKYGASWTRPVHFTGSIAFGFRDVIEQLCHSYEFELGKVLKSPMEGLKLFHS